MSSELDAMYSSMLKNQVPGLWNKVCYPSLKPLSSWMKDLQERVAFMSLWLKSGRPNCFTLPAFFFPQGFMTDNLLSPLSLVPRSLRQCHNHPRSPPSLKDRQTGTHRDSYAHRHADSLARSRETAISRRFAGILQMHARAYSIPIDSLSFSFRLMREETGAELSQPPSDGVYIDGFFLDGARWDRDRRLLADSLPTIMNDTLPVIHFIPTVNFQRDPLDYECPLYKTAVRAGVLSTTGQSTNFVVAVDIPTDKNPDYWNEASQPVAGYVCALPVLSILRTSDPALLGGETTGRTRVMVFLIIAASCEAQLPIPGAH
eukprot:3136619-Pleurochrysis_carterae.AAC.1